MQEVGPEMSFLVAPMASTLVRASCRLPAPACISPQAGVFLRGATPTDDTWLESVPAALRQQWKASRLCHAPPTAIDFLGLAADGGGGRGAPTPPRRGPRIAWVATCAEPQRPLSNAYLAGSDSAKARAQKRRRELQVRLRCRLLREAVASA